MTEPKAAPPEAAETPKAAPADDGALTAAEELQLATLLGKRDAAGPGAGGPRIKIEGPHSSFSYGGVVIGREYTSVPTSLLTAIQQAAAEAGVTLTQEG
jgi:hypothetical protein